MSSGTPQATALGGGARVEGDLHLLHDATVAGEVTGDLISEGRVELTATAHVHGQLRAASVRLAGRVDGEVVAETEAELLAGVTLHGGLTTARLTVAEGVCYDGALRLTGGEPTAARATDRPAMQITRNRSADKPAASGAFPEVPGAENAGLRPRRRVPLPSVI